MKVRLTALLASLAFTAVALADNPPSSPPHGFDNPPSTPPHLIDSPPSTPPHA